MTLRSITQDEIPLFFDVAARGFRNDTALAVERMQAGQFRYTPDDCYVWEDGARGVVAAFVAFQREVNVQGRGVMADLLASVSVPPDQRRRGYANTMLTTRLHDSYEQEIPLALLWPYSIPFYNRLGYGTVTYGEYLEFPLAQLTDFDEMALCRRMTAGDLPAMQALYERERLRHSGWFKRTQFEWEARVQDALGNSKWPEKLEGVVVPGENGELLGYLTYTISYFSGTPPRTLTLWEWMNNSTSITGWRAIAGYIAAQRAQADFLRYTAPQNFPLHHALRERHTHRDRRAMEFTYRDSFSVGAGMMGRIVRPQLAFEQRGWPGDVRGACTITMQDPQLPQNNQAFVLEVEGGEGRVRAANGESGPGATADVRTWSELYANATTPETARLVGRLEADDVAVAFLSAAFADKGWFIHRADWF